MAIEWVRIDDRLIHGQVATTWINDYSIEQVLIINDKMAHDEIQKKVLAMTAPVGVRVNFFEVEQFNSILANNPVKRRTLLLYTNPIDVLKSFRGSLKFDKLNVGNMRFCEGRRQYAYSISLTPEEKRAFQDIMDMGINTFYQMVPREKTVPMRKVLEEGQ